MTRLSVFVSLVFVLSILPAGLADSSTQPTEGGTIAVYNIGPIVTSTWSGYYGDVVSLGAQPSALVSLGNLTAQASNVTNITLEYCDELSGYLLISNSTDIPTLSNLTAGDLGILDSFVVSNFDSGTRTFWRSSNFTIASYTITDVPTTYTHVNGLSQSNVFREGYMMDDGSLIFVAEINSNTIGFDGQLHDFQFLLPQNNGTAVEYYVYALLNCELPVPSWLNITFPEGVYEPYNATVPGTHLFTFFIKFHNLTTNDGDTLECLIQKSDGSFLNLNQTMPDFNSTEFSLNYTMSSSEPVNKTKPWYIHNCSLKNDFGTIYTNDSDYGSHLEKNILVHENPWSKFDTVDDDAYRASRCFLGIPKRYFNNSLYCDYVGDVAFAVSMATGFRLEGYCHDGIDFDANGDLDCADRYCRGIPYSCITHPFAGDPFEGSCTNGLCTETKTIGAKSLTYQYTRYVQENGTLKVRFDAGSYATNKPISYAITDLLGFSASGNYNSTYGLPTETTTFTSYVVEDSDGYTGDVDQVLWVNLSGYESGYWYNISIYIVHLGTDLLIAGVPIYVNSSAPSSWDESEAFSPAIVLPCADGVDNDLNYTTDCADPNCDGEIGGTNCTGGPAYCEYATELTCYDCFNNDRESGYDCADSDCNGLSGNYLDLSDVCELGVEGAGGNYPTNCQDVFDNDQQGGTDCYDTTVCWGKGGTSTVLPCPSEENNTASWCHDDIDNDFDDGSGTRDTNPSSGEDCTDYDCRGVSFAGETCPTSEVLDELGVFQASQCFDNIDNDLDSPSQSYYGPGTNIDCSDSDCSGVVNPATGNTCLDYEYNLSDGIGATYCANSRDDDADAHLGWPQGGIDCTDPDCYQKFGFCGPCPAIENITFDSCSNGVDDDYDDIIYGLGIDCEDSDCLGEIASLESAQRCEINESSCDDGFDNDADGLLDCVDPDCLGELGPRGQICGPENSTPTCSDNQDNDLDSAIDCLDSSCYGVGTCASLNWSSATCLVVPAYSGYMQVGSTSIYVNHLIRHHVNTDYVILIRGTADYDSLTVTLGSAWDASDYFPYNATSCNLTGASGLRWVASQAEVGQLQDNGSQVNGEFIATLTCSGLPTPQINSYPLVVTNGIVGGATENGERTLTTRVYEDVPPTITELEIEPLSGSTANIYYGETYSARAIPSDDPSGICRCRFNVSGTVTFSANYLCTYQSPIQFDDTNDTISAAARDGAYNLGPYNAPTNLTVNVLPQPISIAVDKAKPFYNITESVVFTSSFSTALSGNFISCLAWIENATGVVVSTAVAPSNVANVGNCNSDFNLSALDDGIYYVRVNATDEDSDTATSNRAVFYVCSSYNSSGSDWNCKKADFDQDGIPDVWAGICTFLPEELECLIPNSNLVITQDAVICPGTYFINDQLTPGVIVINASNITVTCNGTILVDYGSGVGISIVNQDNVVIEGCTISNYAVGINVTQSSNVTLYNNTLTSNIYGTQFNNSNGSSIIGNQMNSNQYGTVLTGVNDSLITNNSMLNNTNIGMSLNSSTGNLIYNNFFQNPDNVYDNGNNSWNTSYTCGVINIVGGPCFGGNFFSNYTGEDDGSQILFPYNVSNDTIGDSIPFYNIPGGFNQDFLPLVFGPLVCVDADGDGYFVTGDECGPVDCDDTDIATFPGAPEVCDNKDNDCDNETDEGGVCCGNDICERSKGEGCGSCAEDCGECDEAGREIKGYTFGPPIAIPITPLRLSINLSVTKYVFAADEMVTGVVTIEYDGTHDLDIIVRLYADDLLIAEHEVALRPEYSRITLPFRVSLGPGEHKLRATAETAFFRRIEDSVFVRVLEAPVKPPEEVVEPVKPPKPELDMTLVVVVILLIIFLFFLLWKRRKKKKEEDQ